MITINDVHFGKHTGRKNEGKFQTNSHLAHLKSGVKGFLSIYSRQKEHLTDALQMLVDKELLFTEASLLLTQANHLSQSPQTIPGHMWILVMHLVC